MDNEMAANIVPVLLGADLNCYNVARAFHEAYGVTSYAIGRYPIGVTENTRIIKFKAVDQLDNPQVLAQELAKFADDNGNKHEGKNLILMGCTDDYVALIIKNKALFPQYIKPYIEPALMEEITLKEKFYEFCDKFAIPYPATVVYQRGDALSVPFSYPIIIKPSSSVLYWKYPFDGMKKVYRAKTVAEAENIIREIYASGYPDKLILQDMIPGDDSRMYTMTAYSDKTGKVRMMCLGHVLLEEHTPKGLGNHAAILTETNEPLMEKLKSFLEDIGYVGFSNFDIKYDIRDNTFKLFEINVRQGRSNYYVTAAGNNIARYIVEDWVENKAFEGCHFSKEEIYWRYLPDSIVYKYSDPDTVRRVKALKAAGKAYSSMRYKYDLKHNLKRRIFIFMHEFRHIDKYKKYYNKQEMM